MNVAGMRAAMERAGYTPGRVTDDGTVAWVMSDETFRVGDVDMPMAVGRWDRSTGRFTMVN